MNEPKTLREHIKQEKEKKESRYEEYEALLAEAIHAGDEAAITGHRGGHGKVWISLDDGRTSFARFMRDRHPGMFQYRNRQTGTTYVIGITDYHAAIAYANAFRVALGKGGVKVSVHNSPITREN